MEQFVISTFADNTRTRFSRCNPVGFSTIIFATTAPLFNIDLAPVPMDDSWTYRDSIDLDYCLDQDTDLTPETVHHRDRRIFLDSCQAHGEDDRRLIGCWLRHRRDQLFPGARAHGPGTLVEHFLRTGGLVLCLLGIGFGFSGGLAFFNYSGATPVNVFHFFLLFIFPQLGLLALVLGGAGVRAFGLLRTPSLASRISARLLHLLARRRSSREHSLYLLNRLSSTGALLFWPCFLLSQKLMISINGGLLAATLLKIATTDQAFGWQSTIQVSGPAIHRLVQLLAAPWSWIVGASLAYPSLEDIEGSRIILKEGIYHLATENLVSWWPFLVFALIFYGLILRLLLLLAGTLLQRRSLRRLQRGRPDVMRLLRRMRTPLLRAGGNDQADQLQGLPTERRVPADVSQHPPATKVPVLALIPEDIAGHCSNSVLDRLLHPHGFTVGAREQLRLDEVLSKELLQRLETSVRKQGDSLLLLTEAWSPPINDWLQNCREIRAAAGPDIPLIVGLLGFHHEDGTFARPAATDSRIWRHALGALGDRYLDVIELGETQPTEREASS